MKVFVAALKPESNQCGAARIGNKGQRGHSAAEIQNLGLPWEKNTYRALYDDWNRIISVAGLPKGTKPVPKNFRSTCGSEMIEAGAPTVVVKDFLGHAGVTTTEAFYIDTGPALRAAAEKRRAFHR